jgi:hypothetical protein
MNIEQLIQKINSTQIIKQSKCNVIKKDNLVKLLITEAWYDGPFDKFPTITEFFAIAKIFDKFNWKQLGTIERLIDLNDADAYDTLRQTASYISMMALI